MIKNWVNLETNLVKDWCGGYDYDGNVKMFMYDYFYIRHTELEIVIEW